MEDPEAMLQMHRSFQRALSHRSGKYVAEVLDFSSDEDSCNCKESTCVNKNSITAKLAALNKSRLKSKYAIHSMRPISSAVTGGKDIIKSKKRGYEITCIDKYKNENGGNEPHFIDQNTHSISKISTDCSLTPKCSPHFNPNLNNTSDNFDEFNNLLNRFVRQYNRSDFEKSYETYLRIKELEYQKVAFTPEELVVVAYKMAQIGKKWQFAEIIFYEMRQALSYYEDNFVWSKMSTGRNYVITATNDSEDIPVVMLEASLNTSVKNVASLFHEADYISAWSSTVDFCIKQEELEKTSKVMYIKLKMPLPIGDREIFMLATAVNRLERDGSIFLMGVPLTEDAKAKILGVDISSRSGLKKMNLKTLSFEIVPIAENKCKLKAICSFDPAVQFVGSKLNSYFARKGAVTFMEDLIKACNLFAEENLSLKEGENDYHEWIDSIVSEYLKGRKQTINDTDNRIKK